MSQTNTNYLFQVIPPVADRDSSTGRIDDDGSGFGDHLSQASASVFDVLRSPSRTDTTSVNSTWDNRTPTSSYSDYSSGQSSKLANSPNDRADLSASSSPPSPPEPPIDQAGNSRPATEQDKDKRHDLDKSDDDNTAAESAGAASAGKNTPQKPETSPHKGDGDSAKPLQANGASDDAAHQAAKRAIKVEGKTTKPEQDIKDENAKLAAAADVKAKTDDTATDDNGAVKTDQEGADAGKEAKHDSRADASHATADSIETTHSDKATDKNQTAAADSSAPTTEGSDKATAKAQPKAADTSTAKPTLSSSDSDDSTDDDSRRSSKTTAHANGNADATATVSKADLTAVANVVSTDASDATDSADSTNSAKGTTTKPVTAKLDTATLSLGRTTRPTSEANRSGGVATASETPSVDPARFVGRVAKAMQTANERGGKLQLRLSPPELGSIRMELTVKDGVMSASMETDNANARQVLLEHLPALRDRLAQQNIRVDRFDVDVRQENSGGQANPHGANQQPQQQQQPENTGPRRAAVGQQREDTPLDTPIAAPQISNTGINLVI